MNFNKCDRHQLLNLLHIEKTVLILFPRIRQNLHRFYKVDIVLVCGGGVDDVGQGGGGGGLAGEGPRHCRRH